MNFIVTLLFIAIVIYYVHGVYQIIRGFIEKKKAKKSHPCNKDVIINDEEF